MPSLLNNLYVRLLAIAIFVLVNVNVNVSGVTAYPDLNHNHNHNPIPNITKDLGPLLSPHAAIIFPGTPEFSVATNRDNEQRPPTYAVVIEVVTEADVQETIKYANCNNIPVLATTGLHGSINTLGNLKQGINIRMRKMNTTTIAKNGKTATFGGGILGLEVRDTLWAAGKQTVTAACECVGLVGPLLGGGYGYLQGFYGLVADQLVSARVVLATGEAITVSATEHPDLFWALKGAGHNFGIVTSVTTKIYDVPKNDWAYIQYIFTHDKVEALFSLINSWTANGTIDQPVQFINKHVFTRIPPIDPSNAVIIFQIFYQGIAAVPTNYTAPLLALGPAVAKANVTDYPGLPLLEDIDIANDACSSSDTVNMMFPISLTSYNIHAQRAAFDSFNTLTNDTTFSNSVVLFESYSTQAVKAVPDSSTAFAHRADNILISPIVSYKVNKTLDANAIAFGEQFRTTLHEADKSSQLHAYVNYAHGSETLQELYGQEAWRQVKLRNLKERYDPLGKFDFYAPI